MGPHVKDVADKFEDQYKKKMRVEKKRED